MTAYFTETQALQFNEAIAKAVRAQCDEDREAREQEQLCQLCFYMDGVNPEPVNKCACCGKTKRSKTEYLCPSCARGHELCKRCGADMHFRLRRMRYPYAR